MSAVNVRAALDDATDANDDADTFSAAGMPPSVRQEGAGSGSRASTELAAQVD